MNVNNWYMLFYDKFSISTDVPIKPERGFNNKHTKEITLEHLFNSKQFDRMEGDDAIKKINPTFDVNNTSIYSIPSLDTAMYKIHTFTRAGNPIISCTVIGINIDFLKTKIHKENLNEKPNIPNESFFRQLCNYHRYYQKATDDITALPTSFVKMNNDAEINNNIDKIIASIMNSSGNVTDTAIKDPEFVTTKLFEYQKKSIFWMLQKEKNLCKIKYSINDEILFDTVYYDIIEDKFHLEEDRKALTFYGGGLIDEVGLGKTIQTTVLSLLNPAKNTAHVKPNSFKLHSRATLILCPPHLCGQWKRELKRMIKEDEELVIIDMVSKLQFDKYTYQDLLDADFVLVSFTFFDNPAFLSKWMPLISNIKTYHKSSPHSFDSDAVKAIFQKLGKELLTTPIASLSKRCPLITLIKWHRIAIDEFHEIYTNHKYSYLINLIPMIEATNKWCVTGTPFEKNSNCLYNMINFMSNYTNTDANKILLDKNIVEYLSKNCFRRNTKKGTSDEYQIPPIEERIEWLKFAPTERMMYNAYLANPNNNKFGVFLRQLCCHPQLAEETKNILSTCKTLKDIEKMMVQHYKTGMETSEHKVKILNKRIKLVQKKIRKLERKQAKKLKNKNKNDVSDSDSDSSDSEVDIDELLKNDIIDNPKEIDSDEDDDEEDSPKKKPNKQIIVQKGKAVIADINKPKPDKKDFNLKENEDDILFQIMAQAVGSGQIKGTITIGNLKESLVPMQQKLKVLTKDFEGKRTTYEFYKNVVERIRKTAKSETDTTSSDKQNTEFNKELGGDTNVMNMISNQVNKSPDDDETCAICLDEISEDSIGVTKCGHIFCYTCIKTIVSQSHSCPYCRKKVKDDEVYIISYEMKKKTDDVNKSQDAKDKDTLINEIGTKLGNLIFYLRESNVHTIIFSQWDDLLRKVGKVLSENGIQNVFCRGNVHQRDKAIRDFTTNDKIKVIMLSSESAASGTNLTKASEVILLDPVYGSYEFRKNTEGQAVGRAHRIGQKNIVKVTRFIIRDTVEEEIYKMNVSENDKHKKTSNKSFDIDDYDLDENSQPIPDHDPVSDSE